MTLVTTATNLPRLMKCIGSRLMPASLPEDHDAEAKSEGNAAHWLAQQLFNGADVPVGTKAYNGYVVTDDMLDHVRTYLGALDAGEMEVETTFGATPDSTTQGIGWEVRARADHIKYRDGVLTIDDFKYGWRIVSPVENWTLLAHAMGWVQRNAVPVDNLRIVLRIHQPRPYHQDGPTREWSCSYDQLVGYWHLLDVRLTTADDTLVAGLAQCAKCHALATCPVAREASMNAIDATGLAFSDDLDAAQVAWEYETLNGAEGIIKARRDALEELMTFRIKSGQVIPGYALKQRQGQRRWMTGLSGAALSAAAGVDLTKDGLVTPAEAERRGVGKEVITALTERPNIGVKLERVDADAMARRVFGDGGQV